MRRVLLISIFAYLTLNAYAQNISEKNNAKDDNPIYQNQLGDYYYNKYFQDYKNSDGKNAKVWYTKAAEQGNAHAQYKLGMCYKKHVVKCKKNESPKEQAFKWFMVAAEQGLDSAQYEVGIAYEFGIGIKQSSRKALEYIKLAAAQNHEWALYRLAMYYEVGYAVGKDIPKAIEIYQLLSDSANNDYAAFSIGKLYIDGKEIAKDYLKGLSYLYKAAEQDNIDAGIYLGICYEHGWGVPQDYKMATEIYNTLIAKNADKVVQILSDHYSHLIHPYNEYKINMDSITLEAEQGNPIAQTKLGEVYLDIYKLYNVVQVDLEKSKYWFNKAIDQNYIPAMWTAASIYCRYSVKYENEKYNSSLYKEGIRLYEQAVSLDSVEAPYWYGQHFEWYSEVKNIDEQQSIKWYTMAGNNGFAPAYLARSRLTHDVNDIRLAAEGGDACGQAVLARRLFDKGETEQGWYWMQKAVNQHEMAVYHGLFFMYAKGDYGFTKNMTAAMDVAYEAFKYPRGAEIADDLGRYYHRQENNLIWAKIWYNAALKSGYTSAKYSLTDVENQERMEKLKEESARRDAIFQSIKSMINSITNTTISIINSTASHSSSSTSTSSSSKSSSPSTSSHSGNDGNLLQRDRQTYYNWEDQIRKMGTGLTPYNASTLKNAQSAMKNIRTKWEAKGERMYHSEWEDWK